MQDKEQVIKHLEMVQGVINRLRHDSFLIKGWSMTILVAGIIFVARSQIQPGYIGSSVAISKFFIAKSQIQSAYIVLTFIIPVVGFWILDGYFLWQERLFRKVYDEVRKQAKTDFEINPIKYKDKPKCSWIASMFSVTLNVFYGMEILFVLIVFFILKTFGVS